MLTSKQYKIRSAIVFLFFCMLYACIMFNLYLIQIKNHEFYTHLGEKQYLVTITQAPPRAPIYDRSGITCLALNKDSVSAFILPKSLDAPETLKPFLKKHFPQAFVRLNEHHNSYFMYIKRRLTNEQIALITKSNIQDIKLLSEPSRFYPVQAAGQIIGITDIDNNGLFGIEMQYNNRLAGSPSTFTLEKDARSGHFYFQKKTKIQGRPGTPITLTIDSDLQFILNEELQNTIEEHQAKEGSAIIINPRNGEILAMTNSPGFDPNNTEHLTDMETTKNKVVTEVYELGSVIKACSALAALENGSVTLDELIDCENKLTTYMDGRRINTVPQTVAGLIPFSEVVAKSNNIGIAKVAKRVDTKIYDYYKRLGFGTKTGIPFPGEQKGFVNHPQNWSKQSIISLSYGYEISASLLQLARAFSIIANDGYDVIPTLILEETPQKTSQKKLFSTDSVNGIKEILYKRLPTITDYKLMYKTGTANTLINGEYDQSKNIFTCAGIVEKGDYQRVIVVFIKEVAKKNVYAATVAAPLLMQVAKKLLIHDQIA